MTTKTKIEWTDESWNPVVGCTIATPGCTNCYAMRTAHRLGSMKKMPQYHGTTKLVNGKPVWTGKMSFVDSILMQPLSRKKPTTYFVNSMGDLFHEDVPDEWIDKVFAVMALCTQHTFQVLTKRADRMREYLNAIGRNPSRRFDILLAGRRAGLTLTTVKDIESAISSLPLPNVWLGVSVEDQRRADERIPALLDTPAAVRFISAEPLLGPIDTIGGGKLDMVICGGESGPRARPMHPDWARSLRDQCQAAGVAFFFKQWGAWLPEGQKCPDPNFDGIIDAEEAWDWGDAEERGVLHSFDDGTTAIRLRKGQAGSLLDGREWDEVPHE